MRERAKSLGQVILVGNPNAGKSTVFNAVTGGHAKVGNWHGVTVGPLEREAKYRGECITLCDLPGIYSLDGMSMEERGAVSYIHAHEKAFLLFVCEFSSLARALPLFQSLAKGRRCALILTKKKQFERAGGSCDLQTLKRGLKIPVLVADELGKKSLREAIFGLCHAPEQEIGQLQGYQPPKENLTKAEKLFNHGLFCVLLFFASLIFCFYLTFAPNLLGDFCKSAVEEFFTVRLAARAQGIPSLVLRGFVTDGVLNGLGSVLCFLPQITLLFLFLLIMEESGFLSRLAMHTDGFFSKFGLSGRAMFSLLMGFGCTAAAILTTRGLDNKRIQKRVILCLPYISCSAKLPVYLTLSASFFENPFLAVLLLYALGVGLSFAVALFLKGEETPFIMELAPLQLPNPIFIAKGLFFQIKQFIIKLATVILAFFIASWLLSSFDWSFSYCPIEESMLATICGGLKFLFAPIGMNDWKIAYAALSGLIAKENVAGALSVFYGGFPYTPASAFAFAVFVLACSPCVSAIAATARELGLKTAVLYAVLQTVTALLLSYAVYFMLTGGGVYVAICMAPILAFIIMRKNKVEKIHRRRKHNAEKIHR